MTANFAKRTPRDVGAFCIIFTAKAGSNIPAMDERLDRLEQIRKETESALRLSKEKMKEAYERGKKHAHVFKVGDKVRLLAKDIKIHQKSPKLGPRYLGPFTILERIGDLDYRLELPTSLKINPVFHVDRLAPWHDNGLDKPPPPEPVEVDGEEEYEVERVLDSRLFRRQLQYLVKWKGYPDSDNSWIPWFNIEHAPELVAKFHKENPSAPRRLNATLFAALTFVPREVYTDGPTIDRQWEDGIYTGNLATPHDRYPSGRGC